MSSRDHSRRGFIRVCSRAITAIATSTALPTLAGSKRSFAPAELVNADGEPVTCEALPRGQEFIFRYPYQSTPCFLLNLKRPAARPFELTTEDGERYQWRGGVGPDHSVVAFCAICSHRLTYPTPELSFIGYRESYGGKATDDAELTPLGGVIQCCSEQSIYDPSTGARVLSGPAPQPLAAIDLQVGEHGGLIARGVYGGILFDRFFDKFGFRLALELGEDGVRRAVSDRTTVLPIERYTANRITC